MAITEKDLYPKPDWNFVFGLASYTEQIGVTSMYRLLSYKSGKLDFK
jgi:archaemetzincin